MKIVEIFTSIQGEGLYSGYPTIFLRLAGCNLQCTYCDTPDAQKPDGKEMGVDDIAERVKRSGLLHVCVTGGEPLLQGEELLSLLQLLHDSDLEVSIETNGTIDFEPYQKFTSICMDVKCPSSGEQSNLALLSRIGLNDSVKFVIGSEDDIRYAHESMKRYPIKGTIFWSPVYGTDPQVVAAYILDNKLPVRFQLQLHKVIGVQ